MLRIPHSNTWSIEFAVVSIIISLNGLASNLFSTEHTMEINPYFSRSGSETVLNIREVKISLRQRQRVRNFCVLTSSFLVFFLGSYSLSL